MQNSFQVMVVDDSAVIRSLLTKTLESDPGIRVVASASNGQHALSCIRRQSVDVIVLDIEMPIMDGLTALPKLLAACPTVKVIIASTLSRANAEVTIKALHAGASDYVTKPSASKELRSSVDFQRELVAKVKALGNAARGRPARALLSQGRKTTTPIVPEIGGFRAAGSARPVAARPRFLAAQPEVIAVGSSTGGPSALVNFIGALGDKLPQPILITQHMPATFTTLLADNIKRVTGYPCQEATDGSILQGQMIYVAPGDFHMLVVKEKEKKVIRLSNSPPENYCRPSVDPMLRSLVTLYGARVFVVILTGMGSDGLAGSRAVAKAGGTVIAQDEATSVVWGMPGAVASAGLCSSVLPLDTIGSFVRKSAIRTAA